MKEKLLMICSMLIFGSIGLFVRFIPLTSGQVALWRGATGCLFLCSIVLCMRTKPNIVQLKKNFVPLLISGASLGINWIFLFQAYRYTTISNATLSYYFAPVIVMLLSPILLKEKLGLKQVVSIVMAMSGMLCMVGINHTGIVGIGYGLLAASFYAAVMISNKFIHEIPGRELTVIQLGIATIVMMPYVLFVDGFSILGLSVKAIILLVIVGIVHTGVAYLLYFTALKGLKAQTAAVFSYIDPLSAIVLSCICLGEHLGWATALGGILIIGAALMQEVKFFFPKRKGNG